MLRGNRRDPFYYGIDKMKEKKKKMQRIWNAEHFRDLSKVVGHAAYIFELVVFDSKEQYWLFRTFA